MEYTSKAQAALLLAKKAAKSLRQSYIGTEHILLGLMREQTGVAARVLAAAEIDEEQMLEIIKDMIVPDSQVALKERDGFTPRAQEILELAERQAERFGAAEIGTEHMLLAILKH